jgi:phosphatidate cytidylyltransferase
VTGASESTTVPAPAERGSQNLLMRIAAALVLAPAAIAVAYVGGWLWVALATLAAIGMYVEWLMIVGASRDTRVVAGGVIAITGVGISLALGRVDAAVVVAVLGALGVAIPSVGSRGWNLLGFCYASAALFASALVRADQQWGFTALILILLVVWVTDIGGYFAGRGIGGPKLWPRVSPKKTWAGAIGGFVAALLVATGFGAMGLGKFGPLMVLAAALSIASQFGDLFESAVKRRFGVKDSSHIIPGHGGLLDRLDGFVAAVVLAAAIGILRGGADGVGRGLMVW